MITIGLDARKYFDYGIGTYIQQLIANLSSLKSPHQFMAYVSEDEEARVSLPPGWQKSVVNYGKYSVDEIVFFGHKVNKDGVRILHVPHYTLPVRLRNQSVVSIHDLIHIRFPRYFNVIKRTYAFSMITHAVKKATSVIVDSEFTKIDILKSFVVDERKLKVIHLGIGSEFKPVRSSERLKAFRKRFRLDSPYILFVGNTMPHKGIAQLLGAFALLRNKELDLVMVGGSLSQNQSLVSFAGTLGTRERIKELGRISDEDLVLAYNAAELLVLPSMYEGFGLPAIEAMACGTPVVSSDGGALPEIVGDAAAIFHRGNTGELAETVDQVLRNSRMRSNLVAEGFKNIRRFSWRKTAKKTLQVYEQMM